MKKLLTMFLFIFVIISCLGCGRNKTIQFGMYPQSATGEIKPIEWIVLREREDKKEYLLMSKYILDCKTYNNIKIPTVWEISELRDWLNVNFYNEAFNESEKSKILTPDYERAIRQSFYPKDKVFILSIDELKYFFETDSERIAVGTDYAKNISNLKVNEKSKASPYWLRTNSAYGGVIRHVAYVGYNGVINSEDSGSNADNNSIGVRPVIWIKYE